MSDIVGSLLTTGVPAVLVALAHPNANGQLAGISARAATFVASYPMVVGVIAALWVIMLKGIHSGFLSLAAPERELSREEVARLTAQMEQLTEARTQRLTTVRPGASMNDALNHGQQTLLIVAAVHGYVTSLNASLGSYRVHLLEIRDGKPTRWVTSYPANRQPRSTPDFLCSDGTTAMQAIRTQRIQIVESTSKKRLFGADTHFLVRDHDEGEKGSHICFPIPSPHKPEVRYLLCVSSERDFAFRRKHDELYTWVLDKFGKMLQQEIAIADRKGSR